MDEHCVSTVFWQKDLLSSYASTFEYMRRTEEFTDFKITVQNRSFSGHRLILAAGIPYFRELFSSSESETSVEDIGPDIWESVINFAYSGKIEITGENVRSLLEASKCLQLMQIHDACWKFLEERLHLNNVVEVRTLAGKHNYSRLVDISDNYMRENFEPFLNSANLLTLPFAYLKEILNRDDVKVSSEEKVFESVIRWVKFSSSERKSLLSELLNAVRLSKLTPEYLIKRVCTEELVRTSIPCRDLVEEAKNCHLLPKNRPECGNLITRPRLYVTKCHRPESSDDDDHRTYAVCNSPSGSSLKLFDPQNVKWITLSNFSSDRNICHVNAFRHRIYIFHTKIVLSEKYKILVFNLKTLSWKTVEKRTRPLDDFRAVLHNNKFYFFGGDIGGSDRILCFDPAQDEWLTEEKMTKCCRFPGVASLEGYIYVTGGFIDCSSSKEVERYDPETKEWAKMTPMLSYRFNHMCASLDGKIYACGGCYGGKLRTVEVYDPVINKWCSVRSMTRPRGDLSLVSHNGKLYASERRGGPANMEIYNPEYDEWKFGVAASHDDDCDVFLISAAGGNEIEDDEGSLTQT